MGIDLHDYEAGADYAGDFESEWATLQARLTQAQHALIAYGRSAIIIVDGWESVGCGDAIAALAACWDARRFKAWEAVADPQGRHFLWPYWQKLPALGEITLFEGGWHADILEARMSDGIDATVWTRAYDEINEFEAQQRDAGAILVKLFLHVTGAELERRIDALRDDPWQHVRTTPLQLAKCNHRADYLAPLSEQLEWTDTRWAPWTVIDANNPVSARIAAMTTVAEVMERALPKEPPERADAPFMLQDS
jgi:AMP-polyphosphate phosphotransferase